MNSINVIAPYKHEGLWVFDDDTVGLYKEPFVGGTDELIDMVTAEIDDAETGFVMLFSSTPFPGHQYELEWAGTAQGGNVYHLKQTELLGWLCPALYKYYENAPDKLFVQIKAK